MKTDIFPAGQNSPGNNLAIFLKTPPADPKAPTLAELTAGVDATCYLQADFWDGLGFGQEREDDTRACDASKRESFGVETWGLTEFAHITNPQEVGTTPGNLLKAEILPDTIGYLYLRSGLPQSTAIAATQVINNGFQVSTGAVAELPRSSGKFLRTVQVSMSRILQDYTVPAA